jgi:hypothetical protein
MFGLVIKVSRLQWISRSLIGLGKSYSRVLAAPILLVGAIGDPALHVDTARFARRYRIGEFACRETVGMELRGRGGSVVGSSAQAKPGGQVSP